MKQPTSSKYGLPEKVVYCKKCVISNQRPSSSVEFKHSVTKKHTTISLDDDGVCDACRYAEMKETIDWKTREDELLRLLDKYRKKDGSYDCIVPGSGGKDSVYASHILKYKYGMNPLTVTWPPILYTEYGYRNFRNWIETGGFDNVSFNQNGRAMKLLTRLAIENLLHPFQTFILGQKSYPSKIALKYRIPLVFYGENEAEYGNPIADNSTSFQKKSYQTFSNLDEVLIGGLSIKELLSYEGIRLTDLMAYLPAHFSEFEKFDIEVHYLGYYLKWTPQEAYYYATEHTNFMARPFRSEGTYSKYNSIDDKIDDLHYYTMFIKFGIGRATYDASQEIRNKHITRDEGVRLVHKFDGEMPKKYIGEVLDYIGMTKERFIELCDKFRSPHLWEKTNGEWKLKFRVA